MLEGPHWDPKEQVLYCVSIEQNLIYKINPNSGEIKSFKTNGNVGCAVVTKNNKLLSAEKNGIYEIDSNSGDRKYIDHFEPNKLMRYNDGKLDPIGRFIVGTKNNTEDLSKFGNAKLFSYYDGKYKIILNNITLSNGIGFSPSGEKMYFIDTPTKKVAQYKYDLNTGDIEFEKYIVEIKEAGYPDGMCVDSDGNIWVAEWEGGRVRKWDVNNGNVLDEIILPCPLVTSCCLGGENLNELFITTAKSDKNDVFGGALFRKKLI